jgi:acetyl-CoA synthetase
MLIVAIGVQGRRRPAAAQQQRGPDESRHMTVWQQPRAELTGRDGSLNIAAAALDRHCATGHGERVAFRFIDTAGCVREQTYAELRRDSNRFAAVLQRLGIGRGDRVVALCPRIPALYTAALGTLRTGGIFAALFASYGPEPVLTRLRQAAPKLLLTTDTLYARRLRGFDGQPADMAVMVAGTAAGGCLSYDAMMAEASDTAPPAMTGPEDPALLFFTSGTTGEPKGALHVHGAVIGHLASARHALGLQPGDTYWCTADPGWVTGIVYGLSAPLVCGVTSIIDGGEFDAERWYRILQDHRVTVWYTAPTALRMLRRGGDDLARRFDLSALRLIASVGEPLDAGIVHWCREVLGREVHDSWWQSETGAIILGTAAGEPVTPGAIGRPLPGIEASLVRREGSRLVPVAAGEQGELALRRGWPSMFRGYWHDPLRTAACFAGDHYLSGDWMRCDEAGRFWFVGRGDDVIKSAGHLVGPFEVESVLLAHPAVAEAGVAGRPDPLLGAVVTAFIALRPGFAADEPLRRDIMAFVRRRLGPALAPREIAFVGTLPKTPSGKILRRLLQSGNL